MSFGKKAKAAPVNIAAKVDKTKRDGVSLPSTSRGVLSDICCRPSLLRR